MSRNARFIVGVVLLVVAGVLAGLGYGAHREYRDAAESPLNVDVDEMIPLPEDSGIDIELSSPRSAAADEAERKRNILIALTAAPAVGGVIFLVLGFRAKPSAPAAGKHPAPPSDPQ